MTSASGRFTLVFNGEVYNYEQLRRPLEAEGWKFTGHSDTEVICAAFERWGIEAAVKQFVGMFALPFWLKESSLYWLYYTARLRAVALLTTGRNHKYVK